MDIDMEIQYKTDLYASYMLIKIPAWIDGNQYTFKMLERNRMKGVLSSKERMEDGQSYLYVDITGKKNLIQEYADKEMELEDMIIFFQQLIPVFEELRNYLLTEKMVLLNPEFIYRDLEEETIYLTILPWEREETSLHELAEFFLEKINHRDEHGVNAAYHFYRQQSQPHFSLYQFLPVLEKENILKRQKQREKAGQNYSNNGIQSPYYMSANQGRSSGEMNSHLQEIDTENQSEFTDSFSDSSIKKQEARERKGFWNKFFGKLFFFRKKQNFSITDSDYEYNDMNIKEEKSKQPYTYEETVFFESRDSEDILKLQWKEKGRTKQYALKNLPVTIGKMKEEVSLVVTHPSVSRVHCRFVEQNGEIALMDMNSTNGTFLNGMRLKQGEILEIVKNDEILIGKVRVLVV